MLALKAERVHSWKYWEWYAHGEQAGSISSPPSIEKRSNMQVAATQVHLVNDIVREVPKHSDHECVWLEMHLMFVILLKYQNCCVHKNCKVPCADIPFHFGYLSISRDAYMVMISLKHEMRQP